MKSPQRPQGPSAASVASIGASPAHARLSSGNDSSASNAFHALSFLRDSSRPSTVPSSPSQRPGSKAPSELGESTIGSVFGEMTLEGREETASPAKAQQFAQSLDNVLDSVRQFEAALQSLGSASDMLGRNLEALSHDKIAGNSAESFSAAGGFHLLVANHMEVLKSSLQRQVLEPLKENTVESTKARQTRESEFKTSLRQAKKELAEAEARNRQAARKKNRDLAEYRSMLLDMTTQIDDIHRIKFQFLCDLFHMGNSQAETLKANLGKFVSAEIEIFESISRKGWSGGGLESLLTDDPFEGDMTPRQFTLLNRGILGNAQDGLEENDADVTIRESDEKESVEQGEGDEEDKGEEDGDADSILGGRRRSSVLGSLGS